VARSNAADTLLKLGRYDEARREILRAFECGKPFGHAAEPWKAWDILHRLEQATGHPQAVLEARQQAIQAFLAYRRAGGENQSPKAMLYALVTQALQENSPGPARRVLDQLSGPDAPPWAQALVPKLHAILHGDRRPALAEDPALDYDDAVELQLLLEGLRQ
jgi:tetratricopeptide (TPR) repeat protein